MSKIQNTNLDGWQSKTIAELCHLGRGRVISAIEIEKNSGVYPVYSSQSFNKGEMGRINSYDFEGEYVTWTTDGAYAGSVFYRNGKFNCTNVCGTLKLKSPDDSHLLLAYMFSTQAKKYVSYVGNPKLMNGIVAKIPLIWPVDRQEQVKISNILSTIDESIEITDQLISKYKSVKQGLMQNLFRYGIDEKGQIRSEKTHKFKDSPLGRIPVEWEVGQFSEIARIKRGASPRPIDDPIYFSDIGRGWIRISDVTLIYKYLNKTEQYLSIQGENSSVKVNPGDLIMSICATIGKPAILKMEACIHDGFIYFSKLSKEIDTEWLFYLIDFKQKNIKALNQTGTQGNLNSGIVGKFKFARPDKDEQKRMATLLSNADKTIDDEQKYKQKLLSLKQGLMNDLLIGRVRVNHLLN